jgi:predicted transcriptional regulator
MMLLEIGRNAVRVLEVLRRVVKSDTLLAVKAEDQAAMVLKVIWADIIKDSPVVPVDPSQIAAWLDVSVELVDLPQNVSGAIRKRPNEDAIIVLNSTDSDVRQRFTCAHELGHFMQRLNHGQLESMEFIDYRSGKGSPEETYANAFAAALLMPADKVKTEAESGQPIWQVAKKFGVSAEAMSYRYVNLGIAAPNE